MVHRLGGAAHVGVAQPHRVTKLVRHDRKRVDRVRRRDTPVSIAGVVVQQHGPLGQIAETRRAAEHAPSDRHRDHARLDHRAPEHFVLADHRRCVDAVDDDVGVVVPKNLARRTVVSDINPGLHQWHQSRPPGCLLDAVVLAFFQTALRANVEKHFELSSPRLPPPLPPPLPTFAGNARALGCRIA